MVVGVAIARVCGQDAANRQILLVQRAATETVLPSMYELPGGKSEVNVDATIIDTVVCETREETGLIVRSILSEFPGFDYDAGKGPARQFNFFVDVEEGPVVLDPKEHQAFIWISSAEEARSLPMTPVMLSTVKL